MTTSQLEVVRVPVPTAEAVSREAAEQVLRYFVFHRSLHDGEDGQGPMLERYLALVQDLREGVHVVIADPFQKALAMLFELVLDEAFDPWEIDLVRFTELYLKRIREDGAIDFGVAGRLIFMAWSILWLQSREVLANREPPVEPLAPDDGSFGDDGFAAETGSFEPTELNVDLLRNPDPPALEMMVRHHEARPVSLLELVQAFGEAEQEARRALRIQELRDRLRAEQRAPPEILVHGEIPERDVTDLWSIALQHPVGETFPFLELWEPAEGRDRLVTLFLAALHLDGVSALEVRQQKVVESPILLVRKRDELPPPPRER